MLFSPIRSLSVKVSGCSTEDTVKFDHPSRCFFSESRVRSFPVPLIASVRACAAAQPKTAPGLPTSEGALLLNRSSHGLFARCLAGRPPLAQVVWQPFRSSAFH